MEKAVKIHIQGKYVMIDLENVTIDGKELLTHEKENWSPKDGKRLMEQEEFEAIKYLPHWWDDIRYGLWVTFDTSYEGSFGGTTDVFFPANTALGCGTYLMENHGIFEITPRCLDTFEPFAARGCYIRLVKDVEK